MWMNLPFTIHGKRYSISLISFLCWAGFSLTQFRNNEASVFGLPRGLAVGLCFS